MVLDSAGRPAVLHAVYVQGSNPFVLKVLRCDAAACSTSNTVNSLVNLQYNGCCSSYSMALDSADNPVVTYVNASGELRMLRCNDSACAGSDETDTALATAPNWGSASIVLDTDDHPVVAFTAYTSGSTKLGVLHCNDVACAGGDDVPSLLAGTAGYSPELALDSSGNPVIAHWTTTAFAITHCNDASCTGSDEANSTAPAGGTFGPNVIALDSSGRPVTVSEGTGGFTIATCGDATCSTGIQRSRVRVTLLATKPTFGLDGADRPIIAVPAFPDQGLWVIHCAAPACDTNTDGDGCNDLAERSEGAAADKLERYGAQRDAKNPNDYFNPTGDGQNRIDDILAVIGQYFADDDDGNPGLPPYEPGYNPDTDRTALGPDQWDLGPPNGEQRIDDILAIIYQYFHDCA
jgi:hypothetical protein